MQRHWITGFTLAAYFFAAPLAKADSAADYNEGYNAGFENVAAPDSSSTDDYFAGWNAGHAASVAETNAQTLPSETQDQSGEESAN